jgi:hypothetical protein
MANLEGQASSIYAILSNSNALKISQNKTQIAQEEERGQEKIVN